MLFSHDPSPDFPLFKAGWLRIVWASVSGIFLFSPTKMPVCGPVNMSGVETRHGNNFLSPVPQFFHSEECKQASKLLAPCRMKTKEKIDLFFFLQLFLNMGRVATSSYLRMWPEVSPISLTNIVPGFVLLLRFPVLKLTGQLCRRA